MAGDRTKSRRRLGWGLLALALLALVAAGSYWLGRSTPGAPPSAQLAEAPVPERRYQCPMHPTIVQDEPGTCPICGMQLVPMREGESGGEAEKGERRILFYRSPMDPKVTSPTPRKDEMGMDYLPVYEDEGGGAASTVPGHATVQIDPSRQQLIGLTTAEVRRGRVGGAWRTTGRVAVDETRVRHVNVKVAGFVERIYVDFVGKRVRAGDPLFSLYSPELVSAQEEYLLAMRTRRALPADGPLARDGEALVRAARRKLALWDVPDSEIRRIARTGEAAKTITFRSPASGVVTEKEVVEGMQIAAGAMPYEIVDLSVVWVLADVYESELRFVEEGMPASLTLAAFPNRDFEGRVVFIDPLLDPQTRTVDVRLAFPNPGGDLRPGMFGEVVLRGEPRQGLRIPADAVIHTGTERFVFVALGEGRFQPREVRLGASEGEVVEVVSGLRAGEEVVTRANFLIDSESRLRASLAGLAAEATGPGEQGPDRARVLPDGAGVPPPAQGQGQGGSGDPHRGHRAP